MRWSKLKQRLESNFAESLRGRVALHQTRYRECHDQEGEFWITLDGVRILSIGSMTALNALSKARVDLQETGMSAAGAVSHALDDLDRRGVFVLEQIVRQLTTYLNLSIDEIMTSSSPVVRALGLLDRRFGLRRLQRFDASAEHEFVALLYDLRCRAEGLTLQSARA